MSFPFVVSLSLAHSPNTYLSASCPRPLTAIKKARNGPCPDARLRPYFRTAPAPEPDIELVPLPPPLKPVVEPLFSLPLTRRDLVLFGVGAATVAVGAGIGLLAAWLAGAFKKKEPRLDED